jgi:hypothetical protein
MTRESVTAAALSGVLLAIVTAGYIRATSQPEPAQPGAQCLDVMAQEWLSCDGSPMED